MVLSDVAINKYLPDQVARHAIYKEFTEAQKCQRSSGDSPPAQAQAEHGQPQRQRQQQRQRLPPQAITAAAWYAGRVPQATATIRLRARLAHIAPVWWAIAVPAVVTFLRPAFGNTTAITRASWPRRARRSIAAAQPAPIGALIVMGAIITLIAHCGSIR